jgi:4-alpha-glucanotransferase
VASLGGDFIGLNPMHAPFLADAGRCSPYEPSSRLFLNPLYIAVDRLPFFLWMSVGSIAPVLTTGSTLKGSEPMTLLLQIPFHNRIFS